MSETQIIQHEPEPYRELQPASQFETGLLTSELVAEMENQVKLVKRMRAAVCQLTEPSHWIDIGGNPYLKDGGVHAIASTIGVSFGEPKITEERGEDEDGPYINFICRMSGTWRGKVHWEEGTSSTHDDFFAMAKGVRVPFKDINIGNVRKKAITNAQHRILNKMTGILGTTWELLHSIGINRGAGGTVRHKGSEGRMSTGSGGWTQDKQKLWGFLTAIAGSAEAAAEKLFAMTENPTKGYAGVRDPQKLSDNQVKWLLPRVQKEYEEGSRAPAEASPAAGREPGQEG